MHQSGAPKIRIIILLALTLGGCVLLDPNKIYMYSETESAKEFMLVAWLPGCLDAVIV